MSATLEIDGLSKTYAGGVQALDGVSLQIESGLFGLLGPNGAGKSSLMRILATLLRPDAGTVRLDGIDLLRRPEEIRRRLGYLPQDFGFDPGDRVKDTLSLLARLKGVEPGAVEPAVGAALEAVELAGRRDRKVKTLSGGMLQRLGIAQSLLGDPDLILLDEPTSGLDPEQRTRLLNVLSGVSRDALVILATHIVDDVQRLCGRFAVLADGALHLEGDPRRETERLLGRVWEGPADGVGPVVEAELLTTRLLAGERRARVLASETPGPAFESVEPDLEDVYFHTLAEAGEPRPAPVAGG